MAGEENMKTLWVSDLDGTLLTLKERISEYSLEHLNGLIDGGLSFTYATARSLNSAAKACWGLRQELPVTAHAPRKRAGGAARRRDLLL